MVRFSKYYYIFLALIFLIGAYFIFFKRGVEAPVEKNSVVIVGNKNEDKGFAETEDKVETKIEVKSKVLPEKMLIPVPFTSQAPFGKWDAYHEEACEEASLVMLEYFLDKKMLTPAIAETEIQKMIAFQIKNYGDYKDTTAAETVKLAADFYGIKNLKVIYDFKKEDLKKYLAKGSPIIVPAAGRRLNNPNFKSPGPLYHNLVLVGYAGDMIVTNDPGTRKGQEYRYDADVLYDAIHDFPGQPENIAQGRKAMIILE